MQSLYEEDNIFVQQYIAADGGSKITYRSEASEEQRMKAAVKRKARRCGGKDSAASWGPPDKEQHFDNSQQQKITKNENLVIDNGGRHEVEVRYHDGIWYRGWLSTVNLITGKCDDETAKVNFPDKYV